MQRRGRTNTTSHNAHGINGKSCNHLRELLAWIYVRKCFFPGLPLEQMSYSLCTPSALCCVVCMLLWQDDDKKFNWNRSMVPFQLQRACISLLSCPMGWGLENGPLSPVMIDALIHAWMMTLMYAFSTISLLLAALPRMWEDREWRLLLVGLSDVVHDEQSMLVWLTDAIGLWDTWVIFTSWHSSLLLQRWCFFSGLILGCIFGGYLCGGRLGALLSDFIIWMLTWLMVQDLRGLEFLPPPSCINKPF